MRGKGCNNSKLSSMWPDPTAGAKLSAWAMLSVTRADAGVRVETQESGWAIASDPTEWQYGWGRNLSERCWRESRSATHILMGSRVEDLCVPTNKGSPLLSKMCIKYFVKKIVLPSIWLTHLQWPQLPSAWHSLRTYWVPANCRVWRELKHLAYREQTF